MHPGPRHLREASAPARTVLAALVCVLIALAITGGAASKAHAADVGAPNPTVRGNRLVDARTGQALNVGGVNRSGSEYACAQGWGLFDGPVTDNAIDAIASWGTNTIRLPLNESCWLGINGVRREYSGDAYRTAISDLVDRAARHGLATILDLHWASSGAAPATSQQIAPDADHAPAFWSGVARAFKDRPSVMFELFNEPRDVSWGCWRDGCVTPGGWLATGAQQLLDAVRATGATQPVIVDGLNWGGDLSQWTQHAPVDPLGQLVAGWHAYNFSGCHDASCWDTTVAPVAETYPVLLTEVGEDNCATDFLDQILPWADQHDVGYLAWSWNTASCGSGPALISDYTGTPTAFGAGYRLHLAQRAALPTPSPTPTPSPIPSPNPIPTPSPPVLPPSSHTPAPAPPPLDREALFDFEDGSSQGWASRWGSIVVESSTAQASSGTRSLSMTVDGVGYPAVGTEKGLTGLRPSASLSYRVWMPVGSPAATAIGVSPVLFDGSWKVTVLPSHGLRPGWNTVTFRVPAAVAAVRVLGLQIDDPAGWRGTLALDRVTVAKPRHTFEDGGVSGWHVQLGRASVSNVRTSAYEGRRALRVTPRASGAYTLSTAQVRGLMPGSVGSARVWAPRGVRSTVAAVVTDERAHPCVLPGRALVPGWNEVSFTVPTGRAVVRDIGLRVTPSTGWRGNVLIDDVSW